MLSAEALRIAAVEVLLPTASLLSDSNYPTLAGSRVYDSRVVPLEDLRQDGQYTPVLSLYTPESGVKLRGPHAAADDTEADACLDIVAELAVKATVNGEAMAIPSASDDPAARMVLAFLCSQVRYRLERSKDGLLWRRLVKSIINTEYKTFAMPEVGLRYHSVHTRMHCDIADDDFDMAAGGMPEPLASLYAALPEQSYAKAKLAVLAGCFAGEPLPMLKEARSTNAPIIFGRDDLSP
jgi:hypothetical protein